MKLNRYPLEFLPSLSQAIRDNQPIVSSTISMVYYLWQKTFAHFEIGYGSAISWIILVIILIVTVIQFVLQDRWVTYDVY